MPVHGVGTANDDVAAADDDDVPIGRADDVDAPIEAGHGWWNGVTTYYTTAIYTEFAKWSGRKNKRTSCPPRSLRFAVALNEGVLCEIIFINSCLLTATLMQHTGGGWASGCHRIGKRELLA